MKKAILATLFLLTSANAFAEDIQINVKGMVCSFCAQGIKKNFSKLKEVADVKPDLANHLVTVITKAGEDLNDERIREVITDAGYEVVKIERSGK